MVRGSGSGFGDRGLRKSSTRGSVDRGSVFDFEGASLGSSDESPAQQHSRWLMSQRQEMVSPPDSLDDEEANDVTVMSLNDVASADVRRSMGSKTKPQSLVERARHDGWALQRPNYLSKPLSPALQLEDQNVLQDLSNLMVEQLSKMYAHCEVVLGKQRARHSSDFSLMLRKVDKDLKDTYRSVRETFVHLTRQVMLLLREVEGGRNEVASIQEKFNAAINMAEVRAQYVEELEAVLDGKNPGTSEALRKLTDEAVAAKKALNEAAAEHEERERALSEEIQKLRAKLNRMQAEKEIADGYPPPMLPEMAASWTRRMNPRSAETTPLPGAGDEWRATGSTSPRLAETGSRSVSRSSGVRTPGADIVGSALRSSDDTRAVSRNKMVQPPGNRAPEQRSPALAARAAAREVRKENYVNEEMRRQKKEKDLETRVKQLEERATRQHRLVELASHALQLLRDIFNELRNHWRVRLGGGGEPEGPKIRMLTPPGSPRNSGVVSDEDKQARKGADVLDRVVKLFYEAMPKMGNFQEFFTLLAEEAARPLETESAEEDSQKGNSDVVLPERMPLDPGQFVFGAPRSRRTATAFHGMSEVNPEAPTAQADRSLPEYMPAKPAPRDLGGSSGRSRRVLSAISPMPEDETGMIQVASDDEHPDGEQLAPLQDEIMPGFKEFRERSAPMHASAGPNPFGLRQPQLRAGPLASNLAGPGMSFRAQSPASGRRLLPESGSL